ncbi:MAG: hypothetical protein E7285_06750 [Lachnospiraceae bacterium]|nr:hypothetical protein [Lachnospiraceae bacterium]
MKYLSNNLGMWVFIMEEKKKKYYTPKQAEYAKKYLKNFDEIKIRVPKGDKQIYMDQANQLGYSSFNSFAIAAMNDYIERLHMEIDLQKKTEE